MDNIGAAMRAFFLFTALLLWAGIWLTGIDVVHWLVYIPAVFLVIAAVTGICPGMVFLKKIFKESSP